MTYPKIRKPYDRVRLSTAIAGESMTEQNHEKSCNINNIMARYQDSGLVDHVTKYKPQYGDVSGADFKHAQDLIAAQKTIFHELPSSVRAEFDNDPSNYLDLVMTDEGVAELEAILKPEPDPVVPEPAKTAPEAPQATEETPVT